MLWIVDCEYGEYYCGDRMRELYGIRLLSDCDLYGSEKEQNALIDKEATNQLTIAFDIVLLVHDD